MAWIESHQETARHPKTRKLCRLLNISTPTAVGHLHMFWWWAMDFAPDGDVGKFDPEDIADAAGWEGDPQELIDGFIQSGFIDETETGRGIHDWYDYAGRLIERRQADAERKRNSRKTKPPQKSVPPDVRETSSGHPADVPGMSSVTVPNRTVPIPNQEDKEQTLCDEPAPPESHDEISKATNYSEEFESFWSVYPPGRKRDKAKAYAAWKKKTKASDRPTIIICTRHYATDRRAIGLHGEFAKLPATYLNAESWRDYIDEGGDGLGHQGSGTQPGGSANAGKRDADGAAATAGSHSGFSDSGYAGGRGSGSGGASAPSHSAHDQFVRR